MTRFFVSLLVLLSFLTLSLWAGGKKEFTGQEVNGKENWDYTYDLSNQKPGKYNLIIEGTDKAGNKTIAGPFNVWIDPESDVPIVSIINPVAEQRVGQNLNIVGTCVDDDGVDHVEIQLDGGAPVTATGTEYWSYYLNGTTIPDGKHLLTITGYDIKGVKSKPVSVSFNLDKFKPVNTLTSHENGVLVSGTVKLKGSIVDANGVAKLASSLDGGKTYKDLGFRSDKDGTNAEFELSIDTKTMKDGPNIFWFKSTDRTKSSGVSAFLLMVDNTKPAIRIFNPLPSMSVHGKTGFAGMVFDSVGVQELSWDYAGTSGTIPLYPGNPFFATEFDFTAITTKDVAITFHAVDRAGNRQDVKYPLKIDTEADKPVVQATNLQDKDFTPPDVDITLNLRDDDGIKSLVWVMDKGAEQTMPAAESAMLSLRQLTPGPHVLVLSAIDSLGVRGHPLTINFVVKAPAPVVAFTTIEVDGSPKFSTSIPDLIKPGSNPFLPGTRILQDGANTIKGSINAGNKLKTVEWQAGDGKWAAVSPTLDAATKLWVWSLPLPKNLHFGLVPLSVRASDEYGQIGQASSQVFVVNYAKINEQPAIVFKDSRITAEGLVPLSSTHPLEGLFVGSDAQSIRLEPPSDTVKAELDGNRILVSYLKDGLSKPTVLVVMSRERHEIRSQSLIFRSDSSAPTITIKAPPSSSFVKSPLQLTALIEDQGGIDAVEYSLDKAKTWIASNVTAGSTRIDLKQDLDVAGIEDGPLLILLKARDSSGNEAIMPQVVLKDNAPPLITLDTPLESAWGFVPITGHISDLSRLATLQYRLGSAEFQDVPDGSLDKRFILPVDFGTERADAIELAIRAVDLAGNEAIETRTVAPGTAPDEPAALVPDDKGKLPEPPKPRVSLLSPSATDLVHGKISLAFQLNDYLPAYTQVKFTVSGQAGRVVTEEIRNGYFITSLDLSASKAAQIVCTFDFEGEKRKSSVPLTIKINNEPDKPVASLIWENGAPGFAAAFATDDDGIRQLSATIDGKALEFLDQNAASLLALPDLPAGSHSLSIWAIDSLGSAGPKVEAKFQAREKAPTIELGNLVQAGNNQAFVNGMSIILGKDDKLQVNASFPNGFKSLEYKINGAAAGKGSGSGTAGKVDIALPASLPWGLNSVEIQALSTSGLTSQRQIFFYRLAAADPLANDTVGVSLDTSRLNVAGFIPISPELPLQGILNGRPIKSVSLSPADPDLEASFSGNAIQVKPLKPTLSGARVLIVTDIDGDSFKSEPFTVRYDPDPATITLNSPSTGSWLQKLLTINGLVSENLTMDKLEFAIFGQPGNTAAEPIAANADIKNILVPQAGVFAPLDLAATSSDGSRSFQARIDLQAFRDGTISLALRATDSFGNVTTNYWAFSKDTQGPLLVQLTPPETEKVNGKNTMSGKARDAGRLVSVDFSSDHKNWVPITNADIFSMDLDFGSFAKLPDQWWWRATDAAGNVTEFNPSFNLDQESDKPVVAIQTPVENETVRNDFKISGIAFDDDGIKNLYYRLDYQAPELPAAVSAVAAPFGPPPRPAPAASGILLTNPNAARDNANKENIDLASFTRIDGKNSFELPMKLLEVGDNGHLFEIVGEDINGALGHIVKQPFRISTAEPTSVLIEPATGITIRGTFTMSGTAADNNGIREVWISFDSSSSWVKAIGAEAWSYTLDSTVLKDGVHSVIIKTIDNYDTEGLYNTIITIDNTVPAISLDTPRDGAEESGTLRLSGRLTDNLNLASASVTLLPANNPINQISDTLTQDLSTKTVLLQDVDISALQPGWYTLRIETRDRASNTSWISRDIRVVETKQADRVEILFPVESEVVNGNFSIAGQVFTKGSFPETVTIMANGSSLGDFPVSKTGHFNAQIEPSQVASGIISLVASIPNSLSSAADGASTVQSSVRQFQYSTSGAWLRFASFSSGDYLSERVFLKGSAGYLMPEATADDPAARKAQSQFQKEHQLKSIQISMDHGRSWQAVKGTTDWSYRVETQNYPNGPLYLLFRLVLSNDEVVVRHAIMTIDRTPPELTVLKPGEEGRYNEKIEIAGTARDNYELDSIKVNLRTGDKAAYQVPAGLQGLYLDGHYGGSTTWEAGLGLTFFDNNVKLQVLLGQAPAETRFDGWVMGVKLVANVLYLPFSYFFGPDLDFFSMSFGVGAQFNYLTMSGQEFTFSENGLVLGAALVQWEFARFTFADLEVFKTIGLYTEFQAWFISSDVQATVVPKIAFGARVNIF